MQSLLLDKEEEFEAVGLWSQWVLGFLVHVLPVGARVPSTCATSGC